MGNFFSVPNEGTPQIAESKDEIIRNLQKQVNYLTADREFLYKTVQDVLKDSFDAKQQHLNELRKAQEEIFDLRFKNSQQRYTENPIFIPQAEPIAETQNVEQLLEPLKQENKILQEQLRKTVAENTDLKTNLNQAIASVREVSSDAENYLHQAIKSNEEKKTLLQRLTIAETKPILEDKEIQIGEGFIPIRQSSTPAYPTVSELREARKYFRKCSPNKDI
jgi:hypothetical protein